MDAAVFWRALTGAVVVTLAPVAVAQEPVWDTPIGHDLPAPASEARKVEPWRPRSPGGTAILMGGGLGSFITERARDLTGMSGAWDLRAVGGTRQVVGLEIAYVGSLTYLKGAEFGPDEFIFRNGAEGSVRVNGPIVFTTGLFEPFLFAGIGWNRYSLGNESDQTLVRSKDDLMVLPVGGGLAGSWRGLMLDARFTYRPAFDEDLFGDTGLATWGANLSLGGEF